jgi:hypothetical protein
MLTKIPIAAHDSGNHLPFIGQDLLQESSRPKRPVLEADRGVRFLFAPQTPEKRVDVMQNAEWLSHDRLLLCRTEDRLRRLQPTSPARSASR